MYEYDESLIILRCFIRHIRFLFVRLRRISLTEVSTTSVSPDSTKTMVEPTMKSMTTQFKLDYNYLTSIFSSVEGVTGLTPSYFKNEKGTKARRSPDKL